MHAMVACTLNDLVACKLACFFCHDSLYEYMMHHLVVGLVHICNHDVVDLAWLLASFCDMWHAKSLHDVRCLVSWLHACLIYIPTMMLHVCPA